jgi:hypothetical protein
MTTPPLQPTSARAADLAELPLDADQAAQLDAQLASLRNTLAQVETPAHVAHALRAAARARTRAEARQQPAPTHWRMRMAQWFAPGLGLAASIGMVSWITLMPAHHASIDSPLPLDTTSPFIALQPLESIALESRPRLIETEVPMTVFAEYGVAVNPERAGEKVQAQMLVSAAGRPLAVRFMP